MLEKSYRLTAHYLLGGTESCGDFETMDALEKHLYEFRVRLDKNEVNPRLRPTEYEVRVVYKDYDVIDTI